HAAVDEVERTVENVRTEHQNHAGADRNQAQGRAQLVANRQGADHPGDQRRAKRLDERVCAVAGYGTTQNGADSGAYEYQHRSNGMLDAENHRKRHGARPGSEREKPCRSAWRGRDRAPTAAAAASGVSRPLPSSPIARTADATRSIFTPVGSAVISEMSSPSLSSDLSCSSPQRGKTFARSPSARQSCSAAATVCSVAWPLT